jgi:hypothetical protein
MVGLALADDDARARMLLTQAYTYWYRWKWGWGESSWTGFAQGASRYTCYRYHPWNSDIAIMMKNSTGLDITSGVYLERSMPYYLFLTRPDLSITNGPTDTWATVYATCSNVTDATNAPLASAYLYPSDTFTPYVNYWYKTTWSTYNTASWLSPSGQLVYTFRPYLFMSPTATQTNPSGNLPTQMAFKDTDYNNCVTAFGSAGCWTNQSMDHAVSKSSWATTATYVFQRGGYILSPSAIDHYCEEQNNGCDSISYHIYRNGPLLMPNGSYNSPGGSADNALQLGGSDANFATPSDAPIARWASTDPTGDSQSRYAYWMMDASNIFTAAMNVTRANRHVVHFKKNGTQDYVISYDDVALSSGHQIESYWHYAGAPTVRTASAGYSNGSGSIASTYLSVAGGLAQMSLTDGVGICAGSGTTCDSSATSFEFIAVHYPSRSSRIQTMPGISQPACIGTGANCTVVDIQDPSSPKVAVLARQGGLLTAVSFTSTHSGTAQYLVAGLSPGTYNVIANGSKVVSGATVSSRDNTLYFESASGVLLVTQGAP